MKTTIQYNWCSLDRGNYENHNFEASKRYLNTVDEANRFKENYPELFQLADEDNKRHKGFFIKKVTRTEEILGNA